MNNQSSQFKIEGEIYLYPEFWKKLKETILSPSFLPKVSKTVEKVKELDWSEIREYKLDTARSNEKIYDFPSIGDLVFIVSIPPYHWGEFRWGERNWVANPPTLKFDSPNAPALDLSIHEKISHKYNELYLTNEAEEGETLEILFARGDYEFAKENPKFNIEG